LELCKRIENYDLDSTEEVVPIKISNSIMKVTDGYFMDIKYLQKVKSFDSYKVFSRPGIIKVTRNWNK
jgi:isocitrate dehydrogenase